MGNSTSLLPKGTKFSRWTINSDDSIINGKHRLQECICDCGTIQIVRAYNCSEKTIHSIVNYNSWKNI